MVHEQVAVEKDHFLLVYKEVVIGGSFVVPLVIARKNIFHPLNILKDKVNSLFSNIQHMSDESQIVLTLKTIISNFQTEYEKLIT